MGYRVWVCKRCGKEWVSREERPRRCGKCRSPYWDREKRGKGKRSVVDDETSYVDKVSKELRGAAGPIDIEAREECFPKGPEDEVDCGGGIVREQVVEEDEYTQADARDMKLRAGEKGVYVLFRKMHGRNPATRAEFDLFKETMLVK